MAAKAVKVAKVLIPDVPGEGGGGSTPEVPGGGGSEGGSGTEGEGGAGGESGGETGENTGNSFVVMRTVYSNEEYITSYSCNWAIGVPSFNNGMKLVLYIDDSVCFKSSTSMSKNGDGIDNATSVVFKLENVPDGVTRDEAMTILSGENDEYVLHYDVENHRLVAAYELR